MLFSKGQTGCVLAVTLVVGAVASAAELTVATDFEGGSARVESVDQTTRQIRFRPGGDPGRGWPCWWFLRVDGLANGERATLDLAGSELPARNDGKNTGKPLAENWAMPARATISYDRQTWRQSEPGRRVDGRMRYEVTGTGGPVWVAWGPPFTPSDTDELLEQAVKQSAAASPFSLGMTRGGRTVRGARVCEADRPAPAVVWIQARQHAWESGSSWVARGLLEWLVSADADARQVRGKAETFVVPIMDVDSAATGNGGKEADPRDHNRDWDGSPVYPEVAAAQARLRGVAESGRSVLFLDLHNPGANETRPFFFVGPPELLNEGARSLRGRFLNFARDRIREPFLLDDQVRVTGPAYHPLWRQISGQWVTDHGSPATIAACLETPWNTPQSTPEGYGRVGKALGQAVADYLRSRSPKP